MSQLVQKEKLVEYAILARNIALAVSLFILAIAAGAYFLNQIVILAFQ